MSNWTTSDILKNIRHANYNPLPKPEYRPNGSDTKSALMVEDLKRHMTNEGWQLQLGFIEQGYKPYGCNFPGNVTDVEIAIQDSPGTLFVQDKREWDKDYPGQFCKASHFTSSEVLGSRSDIFKVTLCKDAHAMLNYNTDACRLMGIHAWLVYYHPRVVISTARYIRKEHVIRIYHSIDLSEIPNLICQREGCLLSGAVSGAYPLRQRLFAHKNELKNVHVHGHPGYGAKGTTTPSYLTLLSKYKVAICTASRFGYALRKIIEAVACGCVCITDLPEDDVLPEIDECLIRVHPSISIEDMNALIQKHCSEYSLDDRLYWAYKAQKFYNYQASAERMCHDIERMRCEYSL